MSREPITVQINSKLIELSGAEPEVADTKYWLIKLHDSTLESLKAVQGANVTLISHRGDNVYLCRYSSTDLDRLREVPAVQSIDRYPVSAKIHQDLEDDIKVLLGGPSETAADSVPVPVSILLHEGEPEESATQIAKDLVDDGHAEAEDTKWGPGYVSTTISSNVLPTIAALDSVHVIAPRSGKRTFNDLARQILSAEYPKLRTRNNAPENNSIFDGSGEIIAVGDTGFDDGTAWSANPKFHPAFNPNQLMAAFCSISPKKNATKDPAVMEDQCGHGTHVAASAVGYAQSPSTMVPKGGRIQGTAPGASLVVTQLADNTDNGDIKANDAEGVFEGAYGVGARIFNESWGSEPMENGEQYGYVKAKWIDQYIWNHGDALMCWSAGNDGRKRKMSKRVGAEASAKNILTVGACRSTRPEKDKSMFEETSPPGDAGTIWESSSIGFVGPDAKENAKKGLTRRIKPDVVAPGHLILSARSKGLTGQYLKDVDSRGKSADVNYMFMSGTSMASPLVAGCAAVLRQAVKALPPRIKEPSSALIKALIINGAVPLVATQSEEGFYVPDYYWGFGRVNLQASLQHLEEATAGPEAHCGIFENIMGPGGGANRGVRVAEVVVRDAQTIGLTGEKMRPRLKATLVYIDRADDIIQYRLYLKGESNQRQQGQPAGGPREQCPAGHLA
ncbi:hypothetical protein H9L39_18072 [Fusarium oxysporum f. sp. albedinis]|nr:hypothetical protein H9L39_18072 [Fusarium oxysporum f. sp. albedinis]